MIIIQNILFSYFGSFLFLVSYSHAEKISNTPKIKNEFPALLLQKPDLKPATSNSAAIKIDELCNIKVLIENWGPVASNPSNVAIKWLDANGVPSNYLVNVPSVPKAPNSFQPGIAYSDNFNSKFHSIRPNIPFTISADFTNIVVESQEGNNTKNFSWNISEIDGIPPHCIVRPDLIVKNLNWKNDCTLDVILKNIGATSLNGQSFYVQMSGIVDQSGVEGHVFSVPSLIVGEEITHHIENFKAKNLTTETIANVDKSYNFPAGIITESNENNNTNSTLPPASCIAPPSDLVCSGLYALATKVASNGMEERNIFELDPQNGQILRKITLDRFLWSIACSEGVMYGTEISGNIYKINLETGVTTFHSSLPAPIGTSRSFGGMNNHRLIFHGKDNPSNLSSPNKIYVYNVVSKEIESDFSFTSETESGCSFTEISSNFNNDGIHYLSNSTCFFPPSSVIRTIYKIDLNNQTVVKVFHELLSTTIPLSNPKLAYLEKAGSKFLYVIGYDFYDFLFNPIQQSFAFQSLNDMNYTVWNFAWGEGIGTGTN